MFRLNSLYYRKVEIFFSKSKKFVACIPDIHQKGSLKKMGKHCAFKILMLMLLTDPNLGLLARDCYNPSLMLLKLPQQSHFMLYQF